MQSIAFDTARAATYRFLSRCFFYPDKELLELSNGAGLEEFLHSWHLLGLNGNEELARIIRWLEGWPEKETALLELEKEYTRLFITAYPVVVAPPYSSVYLNSDRQVWGPSTAEAVRLYNAAGLGIAKGFDDIPDHIAAELEFVTYLISEQQKHNQNETPMAQELATIERKFLTEHLFKWAPLFFGRVGEHSRVAFYSGIALLAQKFIDYECKLATISE